jgi:hypothetical protein
LDDVERSESGTVVVLLSFPDGNSLVVDAGDVRRLSTRLIAAEAISSRTEAWAAAELRVALRAIGADAELELDELQAEVLLKSLRNMTRA